MTYDNKITHACSHPAVLDVFCVHITIKRAYTRRSYAAMDVMISKLIASSDETASRTPGRHPGRRLPACEGVSVAGSAARHRGHRAAQPGHRAPGVRRDPAGTQHANRRVTLRSYMPLQTWWSAVRVPGEGCGSSLLLLMLVREMPLSVQVSSCLEDSGKRPCTPCTSGTRPHCAVPDSHLDLCLCR